MHGSTKVVLVAVAAGVLGVVASVLVGGGPGPLLRSEMGQRLLNRAMTASAPPVPDGVAIASRGNKIPALTLPDLQGRIVAVPQAWPGRRLLINVWASWCGPCIEEMPELQRFAVQEGDNGVQVVGIALDDATAVHAFLQRVPVSYPLLLDTPGPADAGVRLGNPKGVLPYSVLVGADGRLLKQRIGPFEQGEIEAWSQH